MKSIENKMTPITKMNSVRNKIWTLFSSVIPFIGDRSILFSCRNIYWQRNAFHLEKH